MAQSPLKLQKLADGNQDNPRHANHLTLSQPRLLISDALLVFQVKDG